MKEEVGLRGFDSVEGFEANVKHRRAVILPWLFVCFPLLLMPSTKGVELIELMKSNGGLLRVLVLLEWDLKDCRSAVLLIDRVGE